MAVFQTPEQYKGKTLDQIRSEAAAQGYDFEPGHIAKAFGISTNTPLGDSYTTKSSAEGGYDISPEQAGREYNFLNKYFKEVSAAEQYASEYTKALQEQINKETSWVNQYIADNPFVFDEELAKQSAQAEYLPYYSEMLGDYLQDVQKQRESTQDELKLLRTLRTLDTGSRTRAYSYAVENAEKGYEGKGLFSSGMRVRDVGKQEIGYKEGLKEAGARFDTGEADINRTLEGYDTAEQRQRRDIFGGATEFGGLAGLGDRGGAYQTALAGGIEQRKGEQLNPYLYNYEQAFKRQFHPGDMTAQDYLPSSYLQS